SLLLLRLLLSSLLLCGLLRGRLSVSRGWRGLRWRAFKFGRTQRLAGLCGRLLRLLWLGLHLVRIGLSLRWRGGGSALRKEKAGKAEYRNAHKENVFSPLEHSIRLWHRRGVAVGLWEARASL